MMFFICSIDFCRASSAPGGRVTVVPVVWVSSVHPQMNKSGASAAGRIRKPLNKHIVLERIVNLSIIASHDVLETFNGREVSLKRLL
jgi:hypothetical protein